GLGETTRILYFHVPCAWIATLAFFVSAFYSLRYLQKQRLELDVRASVAAELGLLFAFLATVTGSIWAKKIWGAYWNWDPRETSIFILLMIYAAYFALRAAVEDGEQRARLAAVYSLIAAVTVPFFVFVVPRIYDSLHPDPLVNREAKIHMDPRMLTVFLSSLAGFTGLFFWIFHLRSTLKMIWEQKMQGVELTGDRT
ncbi:MAG: cytochrome C biogenesis protein, partial [Calditrichaeota bacterium]